MLMSAAETPHPK